jgi:hypothetical protein
MPNSPAPVPAADLAPNVAIASDMCSTVQPLHSVCCSVASGFGALLTPLAALSHLALGQTLLYQVSCGPGRLQSLASAAVVWHVACDVKPGQLMKQSKQRRVWYAADLYDTVSSPCTSVNASARSTFRSLHHVRCGSLHSRTRAAVVC